jgi:hypothetical protein
MRSKVTKILEKGLLPLALFPKKRRQLRKEQNLNCLWFI